MALGAAPAAVLVCLPGVWHGVCNCFLCMPKVMLDTFSDCRFVSLDAILDGV